jgi:predicted nucleic acid-binding protein
MIYVDTTVIAALLMQEPNSAAAAGWYAASEDELVSSVWTMTEFSQVLGWKQRSQQLNAEQAHAVWDSFQRLIGSDLRLLPVDALDYHRASLMAQDPKSQLGAAEALHLACAERAGAKGVATLNENLARQAQKLKLKPVPLTA